jgi:superfamily II DNA or RNA helicase
MGDGSSGSEIPFLPGDWLIDRHNPGLPGQYTGVSRRAGPYIMLQLSYPGGATGFRPLDCLEKVSSGTTGTLSDRLSAGRFGKVRDLQRLTTYEKLKGTLHEIIYSMEAAQIDFYPYQFKPVLKFINSPTERLIIADEVGLGKTIESALIWLELQARRQAHRLLVICPKMLAEKWQEELRSKFLLSARIVDFRELRREVVDLGRMGPSHSFVLIATYSGLRPPRNELKLMRESPEEEPAGSAKTQLLRELFHWPFDFDPFDMVVFDEAHYMRNPATMTFHLGEALATNAGAVLCVSATPVNNSNVDLHSLLRLVDDSFFESQALFEELLEENRPAVQVCNALTRTPLDTGLLDSAIKSLGASRFISESPLYRQLIERAAVLDPNNKTDIVKCQDLAEKLNLMGGYINRTRRVQVKENRPLRDPLVLKVRYSPEEMQIYNTILKLVRTNCQKDSRPFHVFSVIGLQLRAASCLPVIVNEIREGRFGQPDELFEGSMGEEIYDEIYDESPFEETGDVNSIAILNYDFELKDSKYEVLRDVLLEKIPDEKTVVFAYYRPTLAYLRRRLMADNINIALIHGGLPNEIRWREIERFRDSSGPRILLSSEVGSEGIDLQFCRVIINYDLPWNPMRVEQRIGRIDRVGQQAKRLSIINFKVEDTIEERLYDRLHSKLERFANSLGDLEPIIGSEVQRLTVELLSKELTREQEIALMDQAERVIEGRLIQVQALEESEDVLVALSDYLQQKIEEDRKRGRYIQADELESYLADFFERDYQGCELNFNTPAEGCIHIRLTFEAQSSLTRFIEDDRSLSARPFRQREFNITFRRDAIQRLPAGQQKSIHFVNHLSPLIRWITKTNRERAHGFYNVSAILIDYNDLPPGDYCYRIERWRLAGLSKREVLAYGVRPLSGDAIYQAESAEAIILELLRHGKDWDHVECDTEALVQAHAGLEREFDERFSSAVNEYEAENTTVKQIKIQRVRGFYDRRIAQDEQRIRTLREAGRDPRVFRAAEGKLKADHANKEHRLRELEEKARIDMNRDEVAAGVFRVLGR